ncbi:MAG: hypothetical protein E6K56_04335 [Ignavibacteria bacterium]|nr:MAG: hypothetical protein E6K56_04335 [Ignavibacteria bacterium]
MKTFTMVLAVLGVVAMNMTGCGERAGLLESAAVKRSPQMVTHPGPVALQKIIPVSQLITADSGGTVKLSYDNGQIQRHFTIDASLVFAPHAVDRDIVVTMSLDDSLLVLNFIPAMAFNIPAQLQVKAAGLSLSATAASGAYKLFWYNPLTSTWVEMPAQSISVAPAAGSLECINGTIPHFSQYGFGRIFDIITDSLSLLPPVTVHH